MPTDIEWKQNGKNIKAKLGQPLATTDSAWLDLVNSLVASAANMDLKKLTLDLIPASSPPQYDYELTTHDSRKWKQKITFDLPNNPKMTFNVPDPFRLSEFVPQRETRLAIIALVANYDLETLTVNWS